MYTASRDVGKMLRRYVISAALVLSLALSAYLISVALRAPHFRWLGWIGFLPLFVAMRMLQPRLAALAGGLWGFCLYVFLTGGQPAEVDGFNTAIVPSGWLLVLSIVIPLVYVGLAAGLTQSIGFKLLTLALGWTLVEAVIHLFNESGSHNGLITGSDGGAAHVHWLARLIGYVSVGFLVALTNASLIGIVSGVRTHLPPCLSLGGSCDTAERIPSHDVLPILFWAFRKAFPRAPPISVAATT